MSFKIFVINPGSTSTKLSLYDDDKEVFAGDFFHDSSVLKQFETINDQLPFRMRVIDELIEKGEIDLDGLDAVACRGGASYSLKSGTYEVDDLLIADTREAKGGLYHSSMLGVQMGKIIKDRFGGRLLMSDPTVVDEFCDLARITGIKGVYRRASNHALNQKAVARLYAKKIGRRYEELDLIVAHIDGGITITAHHLGRMIDSNDGSGGDGPLTPTRMGSLAVTDVVDHLWDESRQKMRDLCSVAGGFTSYFGTSNADKVHDLVLAGDKEATLVWQAMIYQIAKVIGSMATVLKGHVDGIILTGGLMRFDDILHGIEERCGFIAPISVYAGEYEQKALADNALAVLKGEIEALHYDGRPVFDGFGFE